MPWDLNRLILDFRRSRLLRTDRRVASFPDRRRVESKVIAPSAMPWLWHRTWQSSRSFGRAAVVLRELNRQIRVITHRRYGYGDGDEDFFWGNLLSRLDSTATEASNPATHPRLRTAAYDVSEKGCQKNLRWETTSSNLLTVPITSCSQLSSFFSSYALKLKNCYYYILPTKYFL
jgi:hypothetical protein